MKTILGLSSAALAGATTQSIAAAANSGHTAMLNLRFTILYPFVRLFLTGWEPPAWEWGASKSLRRRSSDLGDEPAPSSSAAGASGNPSGLSLQLQSLLRPQSRAGPHARPSREARSRQRETGLAQSEKRKLSSPQSVGLPPQVGVSL